MSDKNNSNFNNNDDDDYVKSITGLWFSFLLASEATVPEPRWTADAAVEFLRFASKSEEGGNFLFFIVEENSTSFDK